MLHIPSTTKQLSSSNTDNFRWPVNTNIDITTLAGHYIHSNQGHSSNTTNHYNPACSGNYFCMASVLPWIVAKNSFTACLFTCIPERQWENWSSMQDSNLLRSCDSYDGAGYLEQFYMVRVVAYPVRTCCWSASCVSTSCIATFLVHKGEWPAS